MTALFVITLLGVVLFGYVLMMRLDEFIESGGFDDGGQPLPQSEILIYAPDEFAGILGHDLSREDVICRIIMEPHIPEDTRAVTVIAISGSDLDNLLLCSEAKHLYPGVCTIAKCNDALFRTIFENTGIDRVLTGNLSADSIISAMKRGL